MKAVSIRNLSKSYGEVEALNDINLDIEQGELYGFIGPDGGGKTTLFRLIVSLLIPSKGSIEVLGFDTVKEFRSIRQILGYMPGQFALYQDLTVEENLRFFATAFGTSIQENYHLIKDIYSQIEPFKDRQAGKLSGGMKQKLALSCALIHKPELLVLDEPTTGVDAVSRTEFWDMLQKLSADGLSIIVSTPYMDEAERCGRVSLIQQGKILKTDTPEGIRNSGRGKLIRLSDQRHFELLKTMKTFPGNGKAHMAGEFIHFMSDDELVNIAEIKTYLDNQGFPEAKLSMAKPNIEDLFIELMTEAEHE